MREILFKGFFPCETGNTTIYVGGKDVKGDWVYGDYHQKGKYIYETDGSVRYEVIPETVCQSTELQDIKHKDIFEHDVCKWKDSDGAEHYFEVRYKHGCYITSNGDVLYSVLALNVEVVGNIRDKEIKTTAV